MCGGSTGQGRGWGREKSAPCGFAVDRNRQQIGMETERRNVRVTRGERYRLQRDSQKAHECVSEFVCVSARACVCVFCVCVFASLRERERERDVHSMCK